MSVHVIVSIMLFFVLNINICCVFCTAHLVRDKCTPLLRTHAMLLSQLALMKSHVNLCLLTCLIE